MCNADVEDADFIWARQLRKMLLAELPQVDGRPQEER